MKAACFSRVTLWALDARAESAAGGVAGVLSLLVGVVGAADERSALDVLEAHLEAELAERGELLRSVVAAHREVVLRGAQVLADGQDVHVVLPQVEHGALDLLLHLSQPHHEAALDEPTGVELLGVAQDFQRTWVLGLRTNSSI